MVTASSAFPLSLSLSLSLSFLSVLSSVWAAFAEEGEASSAATGVDGRTSDFRGGMFAAEEILKGVRSSRMKMVCGV